MNEIFSEISVTPINKLNNEIVLSFKYKGKPINSFDYTYFDGMDWSNIYSAKDGQGVLDLRPGQVTDNIRIKCEYEFAGESHIDREIENVMALTGGVSFRNAYINVTSVSQEYKQPTVEIKDFRSTTNAVSAKDDYGKQASILNEISKGISQKAYASLEKHFTTKGWSQFQKLIHYGRATLIENSDIQFNTLGDKVICRGLTMSFSFRNNNRNVSKIMWSNCLL